MPLNYPDRIAFYSARRYGGESPADWYRRLRSLADKCAFSKEVLLQVVRDIFVVGFGPGAVGDRLVTEDTEVDMKTLVKDAEDAIASEIPSRHQYRNPKPSTSFDTAEEDTINNLSDEDSDSNFDPDAESSRCELEIDASLADLNLNDKSVKSSTLSLSTLPVSDESEDEDEEDEKSKEEEAEEDITQKKWTSLIHCGPCFLPQYKPLPDNIKLRYDGEKVTLSPAAEEIATLYAKMLNKDEDKEEKNKYTKKAIFNNNFFQDWRKEMTVEEINKIEDLKKCDFSKMCSYFQDMTDELLNDSKNFKTSKEKKYGLCFVDGREEKIPKFTIGPRSLYGGRGESKKMGKVKKQIKPEDVTINCSPNNIPPPPLHHSWKEVVHIQNETWLAKWKEMENVDYTYMRSSPATRARQEDEKNKYETARKLGKKIENIREDYRRFWTAEDRETREMGVALFLLDELALRAGYKVKTRADTFACCSLLVKHIELEFKDNQHFVKFDFPGKDYILYKNEVPVEKKLFVNFREFKRGKNPTDKLFNHINPTKIKTYLNKEIPGLEIKDFRTYRACKLMENKLKELTNPNDNEDLKIASYKLANRSVAILCNHQTSQKKKSSDDSDIYAQIKQKLQQKGKIVERLNENDKLKNNDLKYLKAQIKELKEQKDKFKYCDDDKTFILETSLMNYIDPRIILAWCKKHGISDDSKDIYNKTTRVKHQWAMEQIDENFVF